MSYVRSYEAWQFIYSSLYTAMYVWSSTRMMMIAMVTMMTRVQCNCYCPKPQYGAEAKAGFSRLMCSAQKDSKAEIELEGWVISNVCKPIRCICTVCNSNQVWFWRRQVQKTDNIVLILWRPITLTTIVIALLITILKEGSGYQIGWIFREIAKGGGGGHFQSKNLCCRFWEL